MFQLLKTFLSRRDKTKPHRLVVDTNSMVAAMMKPTGAAGRILDMWENGRVLLLVSREILDEYHFILSQRWIKPHRVKELNRRISEFAKVVAPKDKVHAVKDDPSDNKFLECAAEGRADYIITSDQHLLGLREFQGAEIVTSSQFMKRVGTLEEDDLDANAFPNKTPRPRFRTKTSMYLWNL